MIAAIIAAAAAAAAATWFVLRPMAPPPLMRPMVPPPAGALTIPTTSEPDIALSPDGRTIAYVATGETSRLYVRSLDSLDVKPFTQVGSSPESPFFSPDGQWIAFFDGAAQNALKRVSITGGSAVPLVTSSSVAAASGGNSATTPSGVNGYGVIRVGHLLFPLFDVRDVAVDAIAGHGHRDTRARIRVAARRQSISMMLIRPQPG
jgi:hypothetical protein